MREPAVFQTQIKTANDITAPLVTLTADGQLTVDRYFAWDGPSGPTVDDPTNMRASLAHDALYYLMRLGLLDLLWRDAVDEYLKTCMIEDGAPELRAEAYRWGVSQFGKRNALPGSDRPILTAP